MNKVILEKPNPQEPPQEIPNEPNPTKPYPDKASHFEPSKNNAKDLKRVNKKGIT